MLHTFRIKGTRRPRACVWDHYAHIQRAILHYIFELWEQGMAVSSKSVIIKASSLSMEFCERVAIAQYSSVRQFIECHGLVHKMGTHFSQQDPWELEDIVASFR